MVNPLPANARQRAKLSAPNDEKIVFTKGTEEYKIECGNSPGVIYLEGGNPGKDVVLQLEASNCAVERKIGNTEDTPCEVLKVEKVGTPNWGSTLSEVAPNFYDAFESLKLQFEIRNKQGFTCPIAGFPAIEGSNFKGAYQNPFQRWKYESATSPKFAGENATFTWEYGFTASPRPQALLEGCSLVSGHRLSLVVAVSIFRPTTPPRLIGRVRRLRRAR
jgi:hypothetical protein